MAITLAEQIAEVKRELGMRRRVYPRFIERKQLTPVQADERIALLEAVLETLEQLKAEREPDLF